MITFTSPMSDDDYGDAMAMIAAMASDDVSGLEFLLTTANLPVTTIALLWMIVQLMTEAGVGNVDETIRAGVREYLMSKSE